MKTTPRRRQQAAAVLALLERTYPGAECALVYRSPWELLVATILSAQCTDVRVNQVTPALFARFPGPREMAGADLAELEDLIRSTGFFRNKAKSLLGCAAVLSEEYGGQVPASQEALTALPGVGRKTANVVLGNAFGIPGMVVDTHVKRIAFRLGWTEQTDPVKIEKDLCALLPEAQWTEAGHLLIHHGRALCKAPTPQCSRCPLLELCPRRGVVRSK